MHQIESERVGQKKKKNESERAKISQHEWMDRCLHPRSMYVCTCNICLLYIICSDDIISRCFRLQNQSVCRIASHET